jgi:hypothetical protein
MLWDRSFASWHELGIFSQPAAVLISPDGRELGRWQGRVDTRADEILRRAA